MFQSFRCEANVWSQNGKKKNKTKQKNIMQVTITGDENSVNCKRIWYEVIIS